MENNKLIKETLENLLTDVKNQLTEIAIFNREKNDWEPRLDSNDADVADISTLADDSEEADTRLATLAELENRYHNTMLALEKLVLGKYGRCEIGGETIEDARLRANPLARTCVRHMNDEYQLPI